MMARSFGLLLLAGTWLFLLPVFMPEPLWTSGLVVAASGVALLCVSQRRRLRECLVLVALLLGAQFLTLRLLLFGAASYHDLSPLSPILATLGRCFGLPLVTDHGLLFFQTEEEALPFATNWEKVGLLMPAALFVALTVSAWLRNGGGWRASMARWLGGVVVLTGYTLVRYLVLCGWVIEFGDPKGESSSDRLTLFTNSWVTLLTFVPFAFLAARMKLWDLPAGEPAGAGAAQTLRRRVLSPFAIAASVALALVAFGLCLPGPAKAGRVLVDDFHSGFWEPSLPRFDTNGFGPGCLYNCSSLLEYLQYYHSVRVHTEGPITDELLHGVDVLVLKTPTHRFSPDEVAAIVAFVRRGGGLLLVGDHTNLLGMSSFLNEIAKQFGLEFEFDASNAYSSGYFSTYKAPTLFAHPVTDGLPRINFMTTCTLRHRFDAERIIVGHDLIADLIDYSKPSFFGNLNPSPRNGFGVFPLAVACRFGQGRVAAFADSTTMSNFTSFQDATAQFYLRLVDYLNQTNRDHRLLKWILAAASALFLLVALAMLRRQPRRRVFSHLVTGTLTGYLVAGAALKFVNASTFPPPRPARPFPRVCYLFGPELRYYVPPAIGPCFVALDRAFDALFVMPQRLGVFPSFTPIEDLGRDGMRRAVLVNPADNMPSAELRRLHDFIAAGGSVLVLEDPAANGEFVKTLLAQSSPAKQLFDHQFSLPLVVTNVVNPAPEPAITVPDYSAVTNAAALINFATTNTAVPASAATPPAAPLLRYSAWNIGSGSVYVLSNSSLFSRWWLGNVMAEPNAAQRRAYEVACRTFADFLGPVTRPN